MHISKLPPELLRAVFTYLDKTDLVRACYVCCRWNDILNNFPNVWRNCNAILFDLIPSAEAFAVLKSRQIRKVHLNSLSWISHLSHHVQYLHIEYAGLKNDDVVCITNVMPWLDTLVIRSCPLITDYAFVVIGCGLNRLKQLFVNDCPLVTDYGVYALVRGNENLTTLKITGSHPLTISSIQSIITRSSQLEILTLCFDESLVITDVLFALHKLPKLKMVILYIYVQDYPDNPPRGVDAMEDDVISSCFIRLVYTTFNCFRSEYAHHNIL